MKKKVIFGATGADFVGFLCGTHETSGRIFLPGPAQTLRAGGGGGGQPAAFFQPGGWIPPEGC